MIKFRNWNEYKKHLQSKPDHERRALAVGWWNKLSIYIQEHYSQRYFGRKFNTLTGREIQMIHEGDKPNFNQQK